MQTTLADKINRLREAKIKALLLNKKTTRKEKAATDSFLSCPEAHDIELRQIPSVCNLKWSTEEQDLIDWVITNWDDALFPVSGKIAREKIEGVLKRGPTCAEAQDVSFCNGLKFLQSLIRQLTSASHAQISTETDDTNQCNDVGLTTDSSLHSGQNKTWSDEVQHLINWYVINKSKLPTNQFALSAYETVTNTAEFYAHIDKHIAKGCDKFNESYLESNLKKLQKINNKQTTKKAPNVL